MEGLVDLYAMTGKQDYLTASLNIYDTIRDHERVFTGGIGYLDKLVGAAVMPDGLNEPCDVVYWELRRMGLNEPHYVAPLHCYMHHHNGCVANIPGDLLQLGEATVLPAIKIDELL